MIDSKIRGQDQRANNEREATSSDAQVLRIFENICQKAPRLLRVLQMAYEYPEGSAAGGLSSFSLPASSLASGLTSGVATEGAMRKLGHDRAAQQSAKHWLLMAGRASIAGCLALDVIVCTRMAFSDSQMRKASLISPTTSCNGRTNFSFTC